jgi:hypothetical protein
VSRRRRTLARAGGLAVVALGAGAIARAGISGLTGDASRDTVAMLAFFGGVILVAGGTRLMVGSQKLTELLKPQRNRYR